MIEYKIGEIFNYDLLDMEFKEMNNPMRCTFCFFEYSSSCRKFACSSNERSDNKNGYYKKLGSSINPISIITSPLKYDI